MKIYKKTLTTLILASFYVSQANAVAVSSLFEVADEEGNAEVRVLNNDGKDMFIKMTMSEVNYVDGEKVITPLNKDNVKDWNLTMTPPQLILKPNQKKTVKLHYSCSDESKCSTDRDKVYAIDMSPIPYSEGQKRSVAIAFGYRTYLLVPAKNPKVDYKISREEGGKFYFENNSNTMLNVVVNTCKKEFSNDCIYQYRTLPGAQKTFSFPKSVKSDSSVEMSIINANETFHENINL
ncbi:fimbria/pilus periplasmic chaperone [Vibrio owensii]|uniref:fimbria/pilus periplasmic chaperone n=1 Tax=Vibrio owensii TaxID=696485 RepID=UPI00039ED8C3|nr:fimbria/pilus periplasmic chaperone [Vibrio owensii]